MRRNEMVWYIHKGKSYRSRWVVYGLRYMDFHKRNTPYSNYVLLFLVVFFTLKLSITTDTKTEMYVTEKVRVENIETLPTAEIKKVEEWKYDFRTMDLNLFYPNEFTPFAKTWLSGDARVQYQRRYNHVPYYFIIANMWQETHGGHTGVGRKGGIFGYKGKGIKGYDKVEKDGGVNDGNVSYRSYTYRWEAISDFCKLINKGFYQERINNWEKALPAYPEWVHYALGQQVDVMVRNTPSYATEGVKSIRTFDDYLGRLEKSWKVLNICVKLHNLEFGEGSIDWEVFKNDLNVKIREVVKSAS